MQNGKCALTATTTLSSDRLKNLKLGLKDFMAKSMKIDLSHCPHYGCFPSCTDTGLLDRFIYYTKTSLYHLHIHIRKKVSLPDDHMIG
jgi:hypothetical protein